MDRVFIGSEAIAAGQLTEHELRRWYRPIFRDVYAARSIDPSLRDRTQAAWLCRSGKELSPGGPLLRPCTDADGSTPMSRSN